MYENGFYVAKKPSLINHSAKISEVLPRIVKAFALIQSKKMLTRKSSMNLGIRYCPFEICICDCQKGRYWNPFDNWPSRYLQYKTCKEDPCCVRVKVMAKMSSTPIKLSSELSPIYFGLFPFCCPLIFLSYATALGLLKSFYQIPRLKSSLKFDLQSVQKILNLAMEIECIFLLLLLCAKRNFYSYHIRESGVRKIVLSGSANSDNWKSKRL